MPGRMSGRGQVEFSLIGQDLALSPSSCLFTHLYMRTFRAEVKSNCESSVSYLSRVGEMESSVLR